MGDDKLRVCSFETCPSAHHADIVTCFTCKLDSHVKCYGIAKASLKPVGGACNIQFICDTCLANYKPIGSQVSSMMESMNKKIGAMYNAMAGIQSGFKSSQSQLQQHQEQLSLQRNEIERQQQAVQTQLEQQQKQHQQTNDLLKDIHSRLKENAAATLVSDTAFKNEIKGILVDMKALVTTKPSNTTADTPKNTGRRNKKQAPAAQAATFVNNNINVGDKDVIVSPARSNQLEYRGEQLNGTKSVVVTRLHPSISNSQIVQFIVAKLGLSTEHHNITARALIPKGKSAADLNFVSMLLVVPVELYAATISPTLWPQGALVRDFEDRPRSSKPSGVFLDL